MGWPFTGRAAELAAVRRALRGAGLVVAGPAGVGKTRLLEEAAPGRLVRATSASRTIPLGALAPLLPADPPTGSGLLRAAREALRGTVVGVDDAHLLDGTSAVVLHQLVQHREAVVLATIRSGERAPDPVTALWKDQLLDRLELAPVDRDGVEALLVAVLGGPVDSRSAARFFSATGGNLLLLRELLLATTPRLRDGVWRLDGSWSVPPRLAELVEERLGTLSDARRRVLELLAFGEPLDVDLFDPDELEPLSDRGLVAVAEDGLRLAHPLYGEVLRAGCADVRARNHKRRLAALLDDPLRVAVLRLESGTADDPALLLAAAHRACDAFDLRLGARLARASWEHGGGVAAAHLLAQLLGLDDHAAEAEEVYAAVASPDTPPEVVATRALNLRWGLGRGEEAASLAGLPAGTRAYLLFDSGKPEEARRALPGTDAPEERMLAAMFDAVTGRPVGDFPTAANLRVEVPGPALEVMGYAEWFVRITTGDLLDAERLATAAHTGKDRWDAMRAQWGIYRAITARHRGDLDLAHRTLHEVEPSAMPGFRRFLALVELSVVLAMRGEDGREALARAESLRPDEHGHAALDHARIWVTGASPFAAADAARQRGELAIEAALLHDAVRLGHARRALPRLTELVSRVHGLLVPLYAEHARAVATRDAAAAQRVAAAFSAVGADLYAAEAAAFAGNRALAVGLRARCPGAATPALAEVTAPDLTPRQREVAVLAARGMTNREIADALTTSVRTIDNHLAVAYAKLGITTRAALPDALGVGSGRPRS
ncbi:LuxR C-terminal-related transcriptional regulator [Actinosynnema sp. NPDC020468]|uniref:LuxR C-terminal-related transcriptional regulator n=1 Tax=Actinosynnema sp. NPDC020468 TaxID=3154488 RepID=UPI0034110CED